MKEKAKKNKKEDKIVGKMDLQTYDEMDPDLKILNNKEINHCNIQKNCVEYQKKEDINSNRSNSGKFKSYVYNEADYSNIPKGSHNDILKIKDITINSQDLLGISQDNFFISKKTSKTNKRNHLNSRPKNSRSKILGMNNSIDPIHKVSNSLIKLVEVY